MDKLKLSNEVLATLRRENKSIAAKWHYDDRGSQLFEQISRLDEYYLTKAEVEILRDHAEELFQSLKNTDWHIIELGAGCSTDKVVHILNQVFQKGRNGQYTCVDISKEACDVLLRELRDLYPDNRTDINGINKQYFEALAELKPLPYTKLVLFLGSNIGNFNPSEISEFFQTLVSKVGVGDYLLVGFDMVKDEKTLELAYNDPKGITAEFNLNVLAMLNRELNANFCLEDFTFHCCYDKDLCSVESYLVSTKERTVQINGCEIPFKANEKIHMEHSKKFHPHEIEDLAAECGLEIVQIFSDSRNYFCDVLFKVKG